MPHTVDFDRWQLQLNTISNVNPYKNINQIIVILKCDWNSSQIKNLVDKDQKSPEYLQILLPGCINLYFIIGIIFNPKKSCKIPSSLEFIPFSLFMLFMYRCIFKSLLDVKGQKYFTYCTIKSYLSWAVLR